MKSLKSLLLILPRKGDITFQHHHLHSTLSRLTELMSTVTLKWRISISTLTRQQSSERWISPPIPHDYRRQTWPSLAPCWSGHLLTCRIPLWRVQCWAGTAAPESKRMGRALLLNCVLGACWFHPNGTGSSESTDYAILLYARQPSLYRAPNSFSMNQGSYTRIPGNWIYICFICNLKWMYAWIFFW